jgi:hypothetical protein
MLAFFEIKKLKEIKRIAYLKYHYINKIADHAIKTRMGPAMLFNR